jgi:hypothetical protein
LSPFSAGQPVSYKTNLNRAKTRKWVEAKKNAYDGDDWGDYDEYDEYGVDTPPQQPEPSAAQPSRSFTDPYRQAPLPKPRKNSFDAGEEHRAFSASIPTPHTYAPSQPHIQPPPPIQTQFPPAQSTTSPNSQFPPRKSSIGQHDFSPVATSPRGRTGSSSDKPLPFIRPADIYKRVEEERVRERASLDSSRPSLDSLSHDGPTSPVADKKLPQQQPLDTVAERKSEYLPDVDVTKQQEKKELPQIEGLAALDSDFWSSSPDVQPSVVSPSQDQGLRAVVDKAFTRTDDQNSVPPTPVSKDAGSDMSRSNTGSTSGISPIMSRVPSSATSALKNRNLGDGTTPVIAEEPGEAGTPVSRPTSMHIAQAAPQALHSPPPSHSRNLSSSSLPRSGLATPTRGESPARSPVIASHSKLPEPEAAQIAADSPDSPEGMDGGLSGPSSAYATRESDIAAAMLNSPKSAAPELSAASKQSQDAFLDSHHAQSSISDALPRERSESPSKGRVQALAGKFGDVSHSRRGSTQSNVSRNSVQSWERSHDNSRAASPTKGPSKPSSPTKEFRPKLPGQWESYATMAVTPSDQGQNDKELGQNMAASSLEDADLTPTTPSRPVDEINSSERFDPISALKEAGAAMGESLRESVGLGHGHYSENEQNPDDFKRSLDGEEYMPRPLQLDRTVSALSSTPPTPPQKNTPILEYPPSEDEDTAPPLSRPQRPLMVPQMSTDIMADDQESDRLRKEIVASLSPARTPAVLATEPHNVSLRPGSQDGDRTSSILNDYYGEYGPESPPLSHDVDRNIGENAPSPTQPLTPQKPVVLNRFSWEEKGGLFLTPDKQAQDVVPEPTKGGDKISSPASEHVKTEQYPGGHPDAYFGPEHTFTVTKPDPLTDADLATQPTTPPVEPAMGLSSPTREQTRSPGLHIVNSSLDPEAVDLPPRWSAEHSPHSNATQEKSGEPEQPVERISSNPAVSASIGVPEPHNVTNTDTSLPEPSPVHETDKQLPTADISQPFTSDKPLGAREIATISSASERIATYNKTRDHWATTDHGLGAWLASAHEANPSLATQSYPQPRPQSGAPRHKHTGSLAMLGKFTGSMANQDAQSPSHANPPATASASESGPGGFLSRTASHSIQTKQMQAKGKDLLHTAGVLSGKGMTSAKGLFAKGKSRFNRDKVDK